MVLPWIPRISYGVTVLDLSLPQRPWDPVSRGHGGYEESAAGVPSAWEYRRDEALRLRLRLYDAEWPAVRAWLVYAQRGGSFALQLDQDGPAFNCYLVSPRMGEDIEPRATEFGGVRELEVVVRAVSGAPIDVEYY